jgi:uncharacterized Zn finger protein (UPF0148 family)
MAAHGGCPPIPRCGAALFRSTFRAFCLRRSHSHGHQEAPLREAKVQCSQEPSSSTQSIAPKVTGAQQRQTSHTPRRPAQGEGYEAHGQVNGASCEQAEKDREANRFRLRAFVHVFDLLSAASSAAERGRDAGALVSAFTVPIALLMSS